jgi:hypothetical protein
MKYSPAELGRRKSADGHRPKTLVIYFSKININITLRNFHQNFEVNFCWIFSLSTVPAMRPAYFDVLDLIK